MFLLQYLWKYEDFIMEKHFVSKSHLSSTISAFIPEQSCTKTVCAALFPVKYIGCPNEEKWAISSNFIAAEICSPLSHSSKAFSIL